MDAPPLSIVVPAYREAANLPVLIERVFSALKSAGLRGEVIIVDDASPDDTEAVAAELAQRFDVRLVIRRGERGLSSAVLRGFAEARHDLLVCMDADLSHPPGSLPDLVRPVIEGRADMTIGSRYIPGGGATEDWSAIRRLNSWGATLLARPLTPVRDPMAGFFCLRRGVLQAAEQAGLNPIGYKIGLEILIKSGCRRVVETPITFADRLHGASKMTPRQQAEYLLHLARLYRFRWPVAVPATLIAAAALIGGAIVWMAMR